MRLFFRSGGRLRTGDGSGDVDGVASPAGIAGVPSGRISASAREISCRAVCRLEKERRCMSTAGAGRRRAGGPAAAPAHAAETVGAGSRRGARRGVEIAVWERGDGGS